MNIKQNFDPKNSSGSTTNKIQNKIKKFGYKKLILIALIIGASSWFFFKKGHNDNKKNKSNIVVIKIAKTEIKDVPLEFKVVGNVVAKNSVAVKSRIDSQITQIKFKDGSYVKENQPLFILDNRTLMANLNQLNANLQRDKAQLANLTKQYQRSAQLVKKGYDTVANFDQAKADLEVAKANVKAVEAAINNIKVQIDYTQIKAPISGRAGSINITVGNSVKANDSNPLVVINQIKPIRVEASIPQKYLGIIQQKINSGIIVKITNDNNHISQGKLEYVDNNVDPSTGSFVVKAIFQNDDEKLWPGMFVNMVVDLGLEKNLVTVPNIAIQHGQEGDFVFVINDEKAQKRPVIVARTNNDIAIISEGLKNGEIVATDGMLFLKDGVKVSYTKLTKDR